MVENLSNGIFYNESHFSEDVVIKEIKCPDVDVPIKGVTIKISYNYATKHFNG